MCVCPISYIISYLRGFLSRAGEFSVAGQDSVLQFISALLSCMIGKQITSPVKSSNQI